MILFVKQACKASQLKNKKPTQFSRDGFVKDPHVYLEQVVCLSFFLFFFLAVFLYVVFSFGLCF